MPETSNQNPPAKVPIPILMPIMPPLPFPFDRPFPIFPPHPQIPNLLPSHLQMFHPSLFLSYHLPCFAPVQFDSARGPEIPQEAKDYAHSAAVELGDEYDQEEGDIFVMTDEWVDFFAKSEARRKREKKKQKKQRNARNRQLNKQQSTGDDQV